MATRTPVYLITFDVAPERHRAMVVAVEALGEWALLTPSAFAVATAAAPGEIIEKLHRNIRVDEQIWVVRASAPWAAYGDAGAESFMDALGPEDDWVETK